MHHNESSQFDWLKDRLDQLADANLLRRLIPRQIRGKYLIEGNRKLLNFGSNDYLGLAMEPVRELGPSSKIDIASGATASALVCGYSPLHQQLCREISELEQTESTVLFPTGFAACSGTITALTEAGDLILSDALNHASLIDGCRLSKAERFIYAHRDIKAVESLLTAHRHQFHRAFIVTDSIFSMDGTRAPLGELCDLAERFDAIMIVDEAHATGVFGIRGGGLCEEIGVEHRVPIRIGTLSKAIGSLGGFVTGPEIVTEYLMQSARPLIFSTASPTSNVLASLRGLASIRQQPERRHQLEKLVSTMLSELEQAGFKSTSERTPIVPIVTKDIGLTVSIARELLEAGFFVPAIRPPTVASNASRLRVSLSAIHTEEDIRELVQTIRKIHRRF